jgi:uncharacterized protein YeaO (DUF488 family)
MKYLSPSAQLRKWFDDDPEKWEIFRKAYKAALKKTEMIDELIRHIKNYKAVTLLYAAKDEEHNHALILQQYESKLLH